MTTIDKAKYILQYSVFDTKKGLAEELGLSRPTLNARLSGEKEWKKLEIKWVDYIYRKITEVK